MTTVRLSEISSMADNVVLFLFGKVTSYRVRIVLLSLLLYDMYMSSALLYRLAWLKHIRESLEAI